MKIALISIGTRGDMEPFLAIGKLLKERGIEIICAFPEQFRNLAAYANLEFASLGKKFIELLDSNAGKAALGGSGSGLRKFIAYIKLALKQTEVNRELLNRQYDLIKKHNPDRIIYNGKVIYPIIVEIFNQGKTILVCPVPYAHYVKDNTHVAFNSNFGTFLNKLTYSLADFGLITIVKISAKWLKITERIPRKQIRETIHSNKVIYTISPALFHKPAYWHEKMDILGYHHFDNQGSVEHDPGLVDFINRHRRNKLILITFGSMTNPEPEKKTEVIIDILRRQEIPAIINTASGGLVKPEKYDTDLIYFVPQISYDWIFPQIYGVIHHGGSGTTHMALKYGCATMIIPHIIDQFVWNRIVFKLGAGPKGIGISKFKRNRLEPKIIDLVFNSSYKLNAELLAGKMAKENYKEDLFNFILE